MTYTAPKSELIFVQRVMFLDCLINFNVAILQDGIKRVVNSRPS